MFATFFKVIYSNDIIIGFALEKLNRIITELLISRKMKPREFCHHRIAIRP
jgi:hypothetical protein